MKILAQAIGWADKFLMKHLPVCPVFVASKDFDLLGHNARFYGIGLTVRRRKKEAP